MGKWVVVSYKKWFACQSLTKILTVMSISIFIKPELRKSADVFGVTVPFKYN